MGEQFGNSDDDMERGDYLYEQHRDREMMARHADETAHEKRFVVFVPQIGGGKARPYFFDLESIANVFAKETGGTLFARAEGDGK